MSIVCTGDEVSELVRYAFVFICREAGQNLIVDSTAKEITINGETIPHGQIALEVSMLGREYITELLMLGGYLRQSFLRADMCSFQIENYREVKDRILAIIDFIKTTPPFSHFDTQCSRDVVEDVFSDEHLATIEREFREGSFTKDSSHGTRCSPLL